MKGKKQIMIVIMLFSIILTMSILTIKVLGDYAKDELNSGLVENSYNLYGDTVTTYDFTNFSNWKIGTELKINMYGDHDNNNNPYPKGYQIRENKNFYCVQKGQSYKNGSGQFKISGIIEILGGNIISANVINNNTTQDLTGNLQVNDTSRKANNVLSQIIKEGKEKESEGYWTNGYGYWYRERGETDNNLAINIDVYQRVFWNHLMGWANSNFGQSSILYDYIYIDNSEPVDPGAPSRAETEAEDVYKRIIGETNSNSDTVSISRKDTTSKIDISKTVTEGSTEYAYLGPFKVSYSGNVKELSFYFDSNSTDKKTYAIAEYTGTTFTEITDITKLPNGKDFYVKVPVNEVANKKKLNIYIKIAGTSQLQTTLYILKSETNHQNYAYTTQKYATAEDDLTITCDIVSKAKVSIKKQDSNGNALKAKGIVFNIYELTNLVNPVATLTTDENGNTNTVELYQYREYKIVETTNNIYGYKGGVLGQTSITNGEIISKDNKKANEEYFKITGDNSTLTIKNERQLVDVTIDKVNQYKEKIEGVEFIIKAYTLINSEHWGYIKLYDTNGFVPEVEGDIVINDNETATTVNGKVNYKIEVKHFFGEDGKDKPYSKLTEDEKSQVTKFKTDSNGKISIHNLEKHSTASKTYDYIAYEYKNGYGYHLDTNISTATTLKINETSTITNERNLGNLQLEKAKQGAPNEKLKDVKFKIQIHDAKANKTQYIALYKGNTLQKEIIGEATINEYNDSSKALSTEYIVKYVDREQNATTFITNDKGIILVNNLEVYSTGLISGNILNKYQYRFKEIENPNHGFVNEDKYTEYTYLEKENKSILTKEQKMSNEQAIGNIEIIKEDKDYPNTKLSNVEFVFEVLPAKELNRHSFIALYDENNNLVTEIKNEIVIINTENKAVKTDTGREYRIEYVTFRSTYKNLTDYQKQQITTFVTSDGETMEKGKIEIHNLELYSKDLSNGSKVENIYRIIETSNPNYGYDADLTQDVKLKVKTAVPNAQKFTKISGYVWLEKTEVKSNNYDLVYIDENTDIKLTDLYITDTNRNVTGLNQTPKGVTAPVEIKLYNKKTNTFVKTRPDIFSEDGQYTFENVMVEELENYDVVFVYDGFYYTTVVEQLDKDNGSKVKEVLLERETLNNRFGIVQDDPDNEENKGQAISTDGKSTTTIEYTEGNKHESIVKGLKSDTTLSANTTETGYNLKTKYEDAKANSVNEIVNVNMGIVLREQPKLAIGSDIYSVSVNVNNKNYNYYYNGRQEHYNNLNNDEVGVKFEQESSINRYTKPIYSSDVEAYDKGNTNMGVSLIYKIQLTNQSRTVTSVVHEITNYFDNDYTIEEIGLSIDNNKIGNLLESNIWDNENITKNVEVEYGDGVTPQADKRYNSVKIPLSENGVSGLTLGKGESKNIYIKFNISGSAIKGLLTGESTYHNATEITSYSTYYGEDTGKQTNENGEQEYFCTEQRKAGEIYSGIDKSSQPGNIKLKLIKDARDESGTQTPILDIADYEDDTTSAPSLLLKAEGTRKISGTIFEDTATEESLSRNEKLGDGKYDIENEKTIDGVKVELYEVDSDGKIKTEVTEAGEVIKVQAKYSDGTPATATTDGKGNYTFGNDNVGILPGDYIIQFTYNNKSYIIDEENGNKNLNVNDYKSTIITSPVIKPILKYLQDNRRWYTIKEDYRYSDAIDDIELRSKLDQDDVKYSTYKDSFEETYIMEAKTPVMDIGVEFTETDEADALSMNRIEKLENVDFGIIERPDTNIIIKKEITELGVTTQTGASIIPKGDPSNPGESMQYVKTGLDGLVPVEIESKLLQGATLNVEYSVSVENNSLIDYIEPEYYLYGTGGENIRSLKVKKVIDYLDESMELDSEQNDEKIWTEIKSEEEIKKLYDEGLISDDVCKTLLEGNFHILITEQFEELESPGDSKTVKLYAIKYLATSNRIEENNSVEIIELSGGRTIKESIPGNYNPSAGPADEPDSDTVKLVFTPPNGTTVNYTLYIIAVIVTFIILISGIVIIKKKIMK